MQVSHICVYRCLTHDAPRLPFYTLAFRELKCHPIHYMLALLGGRKAWILNLSFHRFPGRVAPGKVVSTAIRSICFPPPLQSHMPLGVYVGAGLKSLFSLWDRSTSKARVVFGTSTQNLRTPGRKTTRAFGHHIPVTFLFFCIYHGF